MPDRFVFTYQGDGDLAAIGTAEIIHAANRGEKITVIFVNNAIYGMTGGQMAPTTLVGPEDHDHAPRPRPEERGLPASRSAELLATLDGVTSTSRGWPSRRRSMVRQAKEAIRKAFRYQLERQGLLPRRGPVRLPDQLGHDAAWRPTPGSRRR